jgi:hypothetical protein
MHVPTTKSNSIKHGLLLLLILAINCQGQDIPSVFTDKVFRGSGVIDILKDIAPANLDAYLTTTGRLILGVDVNEANSGLESSSSLGVALKQVELLITSTDGDFSFTDFYTNTTAAIVESGSSEAAQFYTLFGTGGSNTLTGSTQDFSEAVMDDVVYLDNIAYTGTILSAKLVIKLLDVANTGGANEDFFDFSGGFEQFAILYEDQAASIELVAAGIDAASSDLVYAVQTLPTAPGAPLPPAEVFGGLAVILILRLVRDGKRAKARV